MGRGEGAVSGEGIVACQVGAGAFFGGGRRVLAGRRFPDRINQQRLVAIQSGEIKLSGKPAGTLVPGQRPQRMSVLEAVAWVAGEPWSDSPESVSPVIAEFMRRWSFDLRDEEKRQILVPLIPRVIDTRSTLTRARIEDRRAWMAADWLVRVQAPAWLELAGIDDHAAALRKLPEITDASVKAALAPIEGARHKAAAAWDATRNELVTRAAAGNAARDAIEAAALFSADSVGEYVCDAAGAPVMTDEVCSAAWNAARVAAWDATQDAVRDAGCALTRSDAETAERDAAQSALRPTVEQLQESALELLDRLIKVGGAH